MVCILAQLISRVNRPHILSGNPVCQGTQPNDCDMCVYLMPCIQQENPIKTGTSPFDMTSMHKRAGLYTRIDVDGQYKCVICAGFSALNTPHPD